MWFHANWWRSIYIGLHFGVTWGLLLQFRRGQGSTGTNRYGGIEPKEERDSGTGSAFLINWVWTVVFWRELTGFKKNPNFVKENINCIFWRCFRCCFTSIGPEECCNFKSPMVLLLVFQRHPVQNINYSVVFSTIKTSAYSLLKLCRRSISV